MTHGICPKIHRYVIATPAGISPIFHVRDEAQEYQDSLDSDSFWVAYHQVPVQQLVDHPDSIETYCAQETALAETSIKGS